VRTASPDSAAAAIAALAPRPRVVVGGNHATPWAAVDALDRVLPEWTLHMLNAQSGVPSREGVTLETCFVGPGMRHQPTLAYVPSRLSMVPVLLRSVLRPDAVVVQTSPPRNGLVSLGIEVNILPAAIEACRRRGGLVVAVANPRMPFTVGDALLQVDDVDLVIEVDTPLPSPPDPPTDADALLIGERVAHRIPDGATLQAGIGAVPDAALRGLTGRRGLTVWSEMVSDGVLLLDRSGALDRDRPVVASFLFGSPELYTWAGSAGRLRMLRTERTNDPALIARNPAMVSLNSALEIDLYDQANAATVGSRVHSGFGGQSDFVSGALHSPGGQALIALRSWHPKADCSTIVPLLDEPVTSFQHTAVVTEQGTAELWGRDRRAQAQSLIDHAAAPWVRDELAEEAVALGLG
jgi:acyl-CoA hydrolase